MTVNENVPVAGHTSTEEPCDVCGNMYDGAFRLTTSDGRAFTFDSLECAAHKIAPVCAHCGCRILGHGVQVDATTYCCSHCERQVGEGATVDRG